MYNDGCSVVKIIHIKMVFCESTWFKISANIVSQGQKKLFNCGCFELPKSAKRGCFCVLVSLPPLRNYLLFYKLTAIWHLFTTIKGAYFPFVQFFQNMVVTMKLTTNTKVCARLCTMGLYKTFPLSYSIAIFSLLCFCFLQPHLCWYLSEKQIQNPSLCLNEESFTTTKPVFYHYNALRQWNISAWLICTHFCCSG